MPANDSKSHPVYFNKWVNEYNNSCHRSVSKKPFEADNSVLTNEIETNLTQDLHLRRSVDPAL